MGACVTTLLLVFTIAFFSGVVSKNSVEVVRHYLTNIALVDPSVPDIIQATPGLCDGNQQVLTPNYFSGSLASFMAYGMAGIAVVVFVLHMRWRLLDCAPIRAQGIHLARTAPYSCSAGGRGTFLRVHSFQVLQQRVPLKLMKNMQLRADLQYLNDLWTRDATKINAFGTTSNEVCVTNCLSETDRTALVTKLAGYLDQYNTLVDGTERGSISPSSIWSKMLPLPGIVGGATLLAIVAVVSRAAYEINQYNRPFLVGIIAVSAVYLVFI